MVGSTPTRFRQMLDDSIAFVGVRTQMWHLSRGFCSQVVPNLWGEPLRWHNFLGHSFRFRKSVLASPSRIRGLGREVLNGSRLADPAKPQTHKMWGDRLGHYPAEFYKVAVSPSIQVFT